MDIKMQKKYLLIISVVDLRGHNLHDARVIVMDPAFAIFEDEIPGVESGILGGSSSSLRFRVRYLFYSKTF